MKKLITVAFILIGVLSLNAQKVPLASTILWKISGKGLPRDSYIYITGKNCDESLNFEEKTKKALETSSALIVEYDLYGSKDVNKLTVDNIAKADSQKIKNNLTPAQLAAFENKLKVAGYPEESLPQLQIYKMNMVYFMLSGLNGPCGIEREPLVFELQLKPLAKKMNKEYSVLQNIDDFLNEGNKLNNLYWRENVNYILNNEDNVKMILKTEADLYKIQNLNELQKLYNNSQFYKLFYISNVQKEHVFFLSEKIENSIKQSSCFFTLQISNVVYKDCSVFEILSEKGYTVTPVF